ncbi:MAG: DUF2975 domain-containing protein [Terricaulis sp.]
MPSKLNTSLRARSGRYRAVITWVTLTVLVLQLLQFFGAYLVRAVEWDQVLVALIMLAPQLCYLYGVWSLRPAFGEVAQGRMFGEAQTKALATLGWSLIVGSVFSIFLLTNLLRLVQFTEGGLLNFDVSDIVLAVVGGALVLLSHLMAKAHAMKSELDDII